MSFRVSEDEQTATVFLDGEIDLERSPEARKALLAALGRRRAVIVDLAEVSYIDSSGVASLIEAFQKARATQREFSLARVGDAVLKVLKLARLDTVFTIVPGAG